MSPQTRAMFDIKKLLLIHAPTLIPRETQDDLLRIAIDLPEFRRIYHWTAGDFHNVLTSKSQTLGISCSAKLTVRS